MNTYCTSVRMNTYGTVCNQSAIMRKERIFFPAEKIENLDPRKASVSVDLSLEGVIRSYVIAALFSSHRFDDRTLEEEEYGSCQRSLHHSIPYSIPLCPHEPQELQRRTRSPNCLRAKAYIYCTILDSLIRSSQKSADPSPCAPPLLPSLPNLVGRLLSQARTLARHPAPHVRTW